MANSFTFDNIDLSGASYGLTIESGTPERLLPDAAYSVARSGGSSHRVGSSGYQPATKTFLCVISGSSESDLLSKRDAIAGVLNAGKGAKKLILDSQNTRYYTALCVSGVETPDMGQSHHKFPLTFQLEGPARAVTATTGSATIDSTPDTFTITSPAGSDYARCVYYVRNSTGGNVSSVALNNTTMGEQISWTGTLPDGYWLRIGSEDSDGRYLFTFDMSTASGADPTALTYANAKTGIGSSGGDWPRLQYGSNNSITITGISAGSFQYSYRAAYLSQ